MMTIETIGEAAPQRAKFKAGTSGLLDKSKLCRGGSCCKWRAVGSGEL